MTAKWLDLLESSSLPGVPILIKSKYSMTKIVWLVFSLLLAGFSINFIVQTIQSYYDFEVVTNINVFREYEPQFPAISFCLELNAGESSIPDVNDVIVDCKFEGAQCNGTDFEFYHDQTNRICYRFNSGLNAFNKPTKIRNSTRNTITTGLNLLFNVDKFQYLNRFGSKINTFVGNASALFIARRPYYFENICNLGKGINSIKIEKEFIQKLAEPYNHCVKQDNNRVFSDLFQYFLRYNKTYLQKDCLDLCIWESIKQNCNCTEPLGEYKRCLNSRFECMTQFFTDYKENRMKIPKNCNNFECPEECDLINYKTHHANFGLIADVQLNLPNVSKLENLYLVGVFYPKSEYTLIDQIPKMSSYDLVSLVGGTLGLFVGVSFFTLVDTIEIFLELIGDFLVKTFKI